MNSYHLGLIKGSSRKNFWSNGHKDSTIILQACRDKDYLSCDLWQYLGERETTKKNLENNKSKILEWINKTYNTNYTSIVIQ